MNKFFIASAIVVALTGTAMASSHSHKSVNGQITDAVTTYKLGNGVVMQVPKGTRVDIDKDSDSLELEITPGVVRTKPFWHFW